jgi:hypothetical protein
VQAPAVTLTMSNDPTARRLLPQTSQMGTFSFAPPAYQQQPRETQKSLTEPCTSPSLVRPGADRVSQIMSLLMSTTGTSG